MNDLWGNPFKALSTDNKMSLISGIGTATGNIAGQMISDGYSSTGGSVLNGLGDITGMIPGPWGAALNVGFKGISGLVNRFFGAKMNEGNINKVKSDINSLQSFKSNATDFDTLSNNWSNMNMGTDFSNSYIGKDGWFSTKAKDKANELREQLEEGRNRAARALAHNADNIASAQVSNLLSNYAAYGGSIHIKPENRGKFTALKERTGKSATWFKEHGTPAQKKMATFALNARKWKHADGGLLTSEGGFNNGVTLVNNGGTHEQNPYEGVQVGVDNNGIPNLVEEGEVIWNDYVFSNRLKVPKGMRSKYRLGNKKNLTFADAAKKAQKESEERPNDPISKRGLEATMMGLMNLQEEERYRRGMNNKNKFSDGGSKNPNRSIFGINLTTPDIFDTALINQAYRNYKNNVLPTPQLLTNNNTASNITYYPTPRLEMPKPLNLLTDDWYNKITRRPLESSYKLDITGNDNTLVESGLEDPDLSEGKGNKNASWLRYSPVVGNAMNVFSDIMGWTNKPDYSNADLIGSAADNLSEVKYDPIGNYLTYKPLDRNYYLNKLYSQAGATRRAIENQSGGNRAAVMAGLLAADYNSQGKIGDLMRQAEEYDLAQREGVEAFNRATNQANSELGLKAAIANQSNDKLRAQARVAGAQLREQIDQLASQGRSANFTNLFESLGNIGLEEYNRGLISSDDSILYDTTRSGKIKYKKKQDNKSKSNTPTKSVRGKGYGSRYNTESEGN